MKSRKNLSRIKTKKNSAQSDFGIDEEGISANSHREVKNGNKKKLTQKGTI